MSPSPGTVNEFFAKVTESRRSDAKRLHQLIRKNAPGLKPVVASGMVGYGPYHYRYATGREGDSFVVSLADRKTGLALYVNAGSGGKYLAESYAPRLGKASVGKSCIRFRRLDDLNEPALAALLREAEKKGGPGAA